MTITTDKKRCALECASVREAASQVGIGEQAHVPCVLLDWQADVFPPDGRQTPVSSQVSGRFASEDESADPVGDGHSDAELAAKLSRQECLDCLRTPNE